MQYDNSTNTFEAPPDKLIKSEAVREMCGGISRMTLWRWTKNPDLGFPAPYVFGGVRCWNEAEVLSWREAQRAQGVAAE